MMPSGLIGYIDESSKLQNEALTQHQACGKKRLTQAVIQQTLFCIVFNNFGGIDAVSLLER